MSYIPHADPAALRVRDIAQWAVITQNLLQLGSVHEPPVPTNLISIFDPGSRVIIQQRPLQPGLHGELARDDLGWVIVLDGRAHPLVQRFAVFHEGFHIIQRVRRLAVEEDWRYRERLANGFARRLLVPRRMLEEKLRKVTDLGQLCHIFQVARTLMQERLKELGR